MEGIGKMGEDRIGGGNVGASVHRSSHCSTIERLYAWEKKLYQEVKVLGPKSHRNFFRKSIFLFQEF